MVHAEIAKARSLAASGQKDEALRIMVGVVQREPDHLEAWMYTARLMPDRDKAIYCLKQVLRIDPSNEQAQFALARLEAHRQPNASPEPESVLSPEISAPRQQAPARDNTNTLLMVGGGMVIFALCALLAVMVQYRGKLLPAGTEPISVTATSGAARPSGSDRFLVARDPRVTYETEYYTIYGGSPEAVLAEMRAKGPESDGVSDALAVTIYQFQPNWYYLTSGDTCTVTDVTVNLPIKFVYPRWEQTGFASTMLLTEWEYFAAHIVTHEEHHAAIAIQCAREMLQGMREILLNDATCGTVDAALNAVIDTEYAECNAIQDEFDSREGLTTFPLP